MNVQYYVNFSKAELDGTVQFINLFYDSSRLTKLIHDYIFYLHWYCIES